MKLLLIIIFSVSLFSKDLEKVTLRLDWLHQFQFAGYYIAKEKGYFKEVGLDVEIKEFKYGINQIDEVINQDVDYAVGKSSLIIDKLNGKNIVCLAAIYQSSPMVLLTTNLSIKKPRDLFNRKVMLTKDARTAASINSMITSKGLKLSDIHFQEHSFNIDDLINGKTDAMGSYISNEPFILKNRNINYNILNPKDYGFDFYGGILFTSKFEVDKNPKRVQNFQKAILKGWDYAFNNIEETVTLIMNKYNTQKKSYSALIYEANVLKELSEINKNKLGDINYKKLDEIKKIYSLLGYVNINQELKDFIIFPKDVLLTKKEKEYLKENTITYLSTINPPFNNGLGNSSIENDYLTLIKNKVRIDIKMKNESLHKPLLKSIIKYSSSFKAMYNPEDIKNSNVLVTKSITKYPLALATLQNSSFITSTSMIKNKKIAIRGNSILLNKLTKDYPNLIIVKTKTIEEALKLLNEEKVYTVAEILPLLNYKLKKLEYPNIKVAGTTELTYDLRYILNKKDKLLFSILNKTIERINSDKKEQIDYKYNKLDYIRTNDKKIFSEIKVIVFISVLLLIILILKLSKEVKKRKEIEKKLSNLEHTDELTGLANRRKILKLLIKSILLSKRYARPLSIIFFDIDNFSKINDNGSPIGDEVLIEFTKVVNKNIRASDILGRWYGDTFLLILPETSKENARRTAENLKEIIAQTKFKIENNLTCSFGVTTLKDDDTKKTLVKRAEEAMYKVKHNLKNDVKVED